MREAQLFFLSDQYYQNFQDDKLMKNKDTVNGIPHNRPCFFAFKDTKRPDIYWIVPIRFGTVLNRDTAFLIQNMCPATEKYLIPYVDKNNCPIRIDDRVAADVTKNAHIVLAKAKRGAKVIFPDVLKIYEMLLDV